jgi:hypothetical protein
MIIEYFGTSKTYAMIESESQVSHDSVMMVPACAIILRERPFCFWELL